MNTLKTFLLGLSLSLALPIAARPLSEQTFRSPGREYGPMTWWHWINGNVTREGIRKDLCAIHRVGIRGVQLFNTHIYLPRGPVEFASEEWFGLVRYAVEVCDSLGLKFTTMTGAGWSGSGGPWITPERAMKKLVWAETTVAGGQAELQLPVPMRVGGFYRDVAVLAVPARYAAGRIEELESKILMKNGAMLRTPFRPEPSETIPRDSVLDLTASTDASGWLRCRIPDGSWTVIRFGYTLTGKKSHPAAYGGEGYEVNKLDADDADFQFEQLLGRLFAATEPYLGNTFEGILFDSYEAHFSNWTKRLPEEFRRLNGYDFMPWLPLFTGRYVGSPRESEQVLHDLRKLLDSLLTECFYGTMQRRVRERGMVVYAEAQGGPVPACAMDRVDVPMNEFWNPDTRPRLTKLKLTASQADFRGRRIVAAEAFTSKPEHGRWQNTPRTMKRPGDLAFAGGVNRFCFHTYAHQPADCAAPGFTLGRYGTLFGRLSTWWEYAGEWITYLTRSQYLLQQGRTVADVCFLMHDDVRYNFPADMVRLPAGYDYRIAFPADMAGARFRDGEVRFASGLSSRLIVLADNGCMDLGTLETLHRLVAGGALLLGPPPATVPSRREAQRLDQARYDRLVADLWGGLDGCTVREKRFGKGRVFRGMTAAEAISRAALRPDIDFGTPTDGAIYHLHRSAPGAEIYYLTNQSDKPFHLRALFRVAGLQPELWDPLTGEVSPARVTHTDSRGVGVELVLEPARALFVVFRKPLPADRKAYSRAAAEPYPVRTLPVEGPWTILFADRRQRAADTTVSELTSWHRSDDCRMRYYSGTAVYTTGFEVPADLLAGGERILLDLGEVCDIARVELNGRDLGTVWTPPFSLDVTGALRSGRNRLKVSVANTWINRLIGDEHLPEDLAYETAGTKFTAGRLTALPEWLYSGAQPADRRRIAFTTWKHYAASSPLVPSGLLGPVRLTVCRKR